MKRKNYKLNATGHIVYCNGTNEYPTALQIIEVTLTDRAMFSGYIAKDKNDNTYIIRDSGEIFDTKREAAEYLRELCDNAMKEAR